MPNSKSTRGKLPAQALGQPGSALARRPPGCSPAGRGSSRPAERPWHQHRQHPHRALWLAGVKTGAAAAAASPHNSRRHRQRALSCAQWRRRCWRKRCTWPCPGLPWAGCVEGVPGQQEAAAGGRQARASGGEGRHLFALLRLVWHAPVLQVCVGHRGGVCSAYARGRQLRCSARPCPAFLAGGGGGALAQLQAISRGIRGLQGDIAGFLLDARQRQQQGERQQQEEQGPRGAPGGAPAAPLGDGGSAGAWRQAPSGTPGQPSAMGAGAAPVERQARRAVKERAPPPAGAPGGDPSAVAGAHCRPAPPGQLPSPASAPDDLFTDDFVLGMITGTDFARLQRQGGAAAAAAAAGQCGAAAGAPQAVVAERVGRLSRGGKRASM